MNSLAGNSKETRYFCEESLPGAARIIRDGGLVVFPTETVYGLGADAGNNAACQSIYAVKQRPADNPLIVHVHSLDALAECVDSVPDDVRVLFDQFSPGPLTFVLPKSMKICDTATAGKATVAIRIPSHPLALRFLEAGGIPVAGPSANVSGKNSPTSFQMVHETLRGKVDGIIDGGDCSVGVESTILGFSGGKVQILRPGAVTYEMICDCLGKDAVKPFNSGGSQQSHGVPGERYAHYQPKAQVYLLACKANYNLRNRFPQGQIAYIGLSEPELADENIEKIVCKDVVDYAQNLYRAFYRFDSAGCQAIIAELPPRTGLGEALIDRLTKAADNRFLD